MQRQQHCPAHASRSFCDLIKLPCADTLTFDAWGALRLISKPVLTYHVTPLAVLCEGLGSLLTCECFLHAYAVAMHVTVPAQSELPWTQLGAGMEGFMIKTGFYDK